MPWAHRRNLFLTVSASTFAALQDIGVSADRIRLICNGVEPGPPPAPRSPEPLFLALGRLADYKRIDLLLRLWERVRHVVGGRLVIAGDGPERGATRGPGRARRRRSPGRVSEEEKHRLLCRRPGCCCTRPASRAGASSSPRPRSAARRRSGSACPACATRSCTTRPGCWSGPRASSPPRGRHWRSIDRNREPRWAGRPRAGHAAALVGGGRRVLAVADEALARARVAGQAVQAIAVDDAAAAEAAIGYLAAAVGRHAVGSRHEHARRSRRAGSPLRDVLRGPGRSRELGTRPGPAPGRDARRRSLAGRAAPGADPGRRLRRRVRDRAWRRQRIPGHRFAGLDWSAARSLRAWRETGLSPCCRPGSTRPAADQVRPASTS